MKCIKLIAVLLLSLVIVCGAAAAEFLEEVPEYLGQPVEDFTIETVNGGTFTLSEALKTHDVVFIDLWASWCEPCEQEFPLLQAAYEKYGDRVAVVAVNIDETEDAALIADYAESHGLTIPMGSDTPGLLDYFQVYSIPTSVLIDRFGNAAFMAAGSLTSADAFDRLFDAYLAEDYQETMVLTELPAARPDVEPADAAALSAAANAEGGALVFDNDDDPYTWPMTPVEVDGRTALVSSNVGRSESFCAVFTQVTAAEGDALAFECRVSTEAAMDLFEVLVDDVAVKAFGGEHPWNLCAVPLEAGEHRIEFSYSKDEIESAGEDRVWLDGVRLVSGEEAAALLAGVEAPPTADALSMTVLGEVSEVQLNDPEEIMENYFGCQSGWIVNGDSITLDIALIPEIDPQRAFVYNAFDGSILPLAEAVKADGSGYAVEIDTKPLADSEEGYEAIEFYAGLREEDELYRRGVLLYRDADAVNGLIDALTGEEIEISWINAD